MQHTHAEAQALSVAELAALTLPLAESFAPAFKVGDRVTVERDGITHYGTVHQDEGYPVQYVATSGPFAGRVMVTVRWVSLAGLVANHPADTLSKVCGVCPDCRALNCRPGCLQ